jgi:LDH2 family malate/lactate/ureidoglycolate dehydrogenase
MTAARTWTAANLHEFAGALLSKAGVENRKSEVVAELLVEADLMGHDTHGLALLPRYLEEITTGRMRTGAHQH